MAEAEHVIVRGVMVAVAVFVAPALGLATIGRQQEQECDRGKEKGPGTAPRSAAPGRRAPWWASWSPLGGPLGHILTGPAYHAGGESRFWISTPRGPAGRSADERPARVVLLGSDSTRGLPPGGPAAPGCTGEPSENPAWLGGGTGASAMSACTPAA